MEVGGASWILHPAAPHPNPSVCPPTFPHQLVRLLLNPDPHLLFSAFHLPAPNQPSLPPIFSSTLPFAFGPVGSAPANLLHDPQSPSTATCRPPSSPQLGGTRASDSFSGSLHLYGSLFPSLASAPSPKALSPWPPQVLVHLSSSPLPPGSSGVNAPGPPSPGSHLQLAGSGGSRGHWRLGQSAEQSGRCRRGSPGAQGPNGACWEIHSSS